jgi:hypothetical protein
MIDKLIKEMHKGSLTGYFSLFIEGVNDTGDDTVAETKTCRHLKIFPSRARIRITKLKYFNPKIV